MFPLSTEILNLCACNGQFSETRLEVNGTNTGMTSKQIKRQHEVMGRGSYQCVLELMAVLSLLLKLLLLLT